MVHLDLGGSLKGSGLPLLVWGSCLVRPLRETKGHVGATLGLSWGFSCFGFPQFQLNRPQQHLDRHRCERSAVVSDTMCTKTHGPGIEILITLPFKKIVGHGSNDT